MESSLAFVSGTRAPAESFGPGPSDWITDRCDTLKERIRDLNTRLGEITLPDHTTDQSAVEGGLIRSLFADVWDCAPFRAYLPEAFGGEANNAADVIATLDTVAFHHLPLGLAVALQGALFIRPVSLFADPERATEVLSRFNGPTPFIGGMMMTEPQCGTDLFAAETAVEHTKGGYRIQGQKHWSGMTGHADCWLIFAKDEEAGRRQRFSYYLAPVGSSRDGFQVQEYYRAHGLSPIPYGRTKLDVEVPANALMGGEEGYPSVVASILQGSRLTTGGIAHGFIRRILAEATAHTDARTVFGNPLSQLDQVACRLDRIRFAELITRGMCEYAINDVRTLHAVSAESRGCSRILKALGTDLMCDSATNLALLQGSLGFCERAGGFGAIADSHPFRIFEGPNDILYDQIGGDVLRRNQGGSLADMLAGRSFTARTAAVSRLLDCPVEDMSQRGRVLLGRVLSFAEALRWIGDAASVTAAEREFAAEHAEVEIGQLALSLSIFGCGASGATPHRG